MPMPSCTGAWLRRCSGVEKEMRDLIKRLMFMASAVFVFPSRLSFLLRSRFQGSDRALAGSSQLWALVPGLLGQYCRRAFLNQTLEFCHRTVTVEQGTLFSKTGTRLGENVYVGPACHIGLAQIEDDVLIAAGVHIPSGPNTHGTERLDIPYREQPGELERIRIGRGAWIGSASVVMADIGDQSIVAAGAVVTEPVPARVVVAGVPARVVKALSESPTSEA